ncbi:MAG: ABC transporter substrate-binding protein [Erysipelotrichaceae bacterium]|nr:ABC transporter substrate-binding protein [Erysipelotrichaceae bacterium]
MKKITLIILTAILLLSFGGCQKKPQEIEAGSFRVISLKGPTSMGLVKLLQDNDDRKSFNSYESTMVTDASEVTAALINGSADIAMLPANAAAALFNKQGGFKVVAINTLGVLYIVENGETLTSIRDLEGKTVYLTGKGTTPEYALRYLLGYYGIEESVTLEFCSEATEVATFLKDGVASIGLLPQPFVTSALMQNDRLRIALSLTDEWAKTTDKSQLVTGVTVVRTEILEKHPDQIAKFLEEYEASINWVNENPADAAVLIEKLGIVAKAAIAQKALPFCNIAFISGAKCKDVLSGYLQTLFEANPKTVGGQMPADEFYY